MGTVVVSSQRAIGFLGLVERVSLRQARVTIQVRLSLLQGQFGPCSAVLRLSWGWPGPWPCYPRAFIPDNIVESVGAESTPVPATPSV